MKQYGGSPRHYRDNQVIHGKKEDFMPDPDLR
ncbi:hypothetical protein SAMN04488602_105137 [Paenibacillus sp. cl123]|nr:hypothetical protein SAMN04488602_105137 [Paenibacillus sp. cl123]